MAENSMNPLCIFCGADSSLSRSREHIIPESLGNVEHVLEPGIVCDVCNNYFANSVEKPVLESKWFSGLRFRQLVPNKRGRFSTVSCIFPPRQNSVPVTRDAMGNLIIAMEADGWIPPKRGTLYLPATDKEPQEPTFSRFVAKMALEGLAHRLVAADGGVEHVATCKGLNPIRKYARYGKTGMVWPVHKRTLYTEADEHQNVQTGEVYQVLHEFDLVLTEDLDLLFAVAIFGREYVINMGEPTLTPYHQWLQNHEGRSPLYSGKNAGIDQLLRSTDPGRSFYPHRP